MKKTFLSRPIVPFRGALFLACLCFAVVGYGRGKAETDILPKITDPVFRAYCLSQMSDWDTDGDGELSLEEAGAVRYLDLGDVGGSKIASLAGIEYFRGLTYLNCSFHALSSLDVSKNWDLATLRCNDNALTSLKVSQNTRLTALWCHDNALKSLDVSKNGALTDLNCSDNRLTALDVSHNPTLTLLSCYGNRLRSLDLTHNPALVYLHGSDNLLESLDISQNPALTGLDCDGNPGDGEVFSVKARFDNLGIPDDSSHEFTTGSWQSAGSTITIDYHY